MNLYQCEAKAQDNGYDSMKFIAMFPSGPTKCQWFDAYFGLFKIDDHEGFVTTKQIDERFPELVCIEVEVDK